MDGYYKVIKRCIFDCGYSVDISKEFNAPLGLTVPGEEPKSEVKSDNRKHYVDTVAKLLMENSAPKSTGTLKNSLSNSPFITVDSSILESEKKSKYLFSILPNCPECMEYDWSVTSDYVVEHRRMEARAHCQNCHCEFDISDYYGLAAYGDCLELLRKDYGVGCLDDCELKLIRKPKKTKMFVGGSVL